MLMGVGEGSLKILERTNHHRRTVSEKTQDRGISFDKRDLFS